MSSPTDPSDLLSRLASLPDAAPYLSAEEVARATALLTVGQAALATRREVLQTQVPTPAPNATDRLLTPAEVAERLGVTLRWLYRNAGRLPFTRKLTKRTLRFEERGLAKYIREKKP